MTPSSLARTGIAAMLAGIATLVCSGSASGARSNAQIAQWVAEATDVSETALSPDGLWVLYTVSKGSVGSNNYANALFLQKLDASGRAAGAAVSVVQTTSDSAAKFMPRWLPDSQRFSYFGERGPSRTSPFVIYAVQGGTRTTLELNDAVTATKEGKSSRPPVKSIGADYRWSPTGRFLAFTAPLTSGNGLDPRRGVKASTNWTAEGAGTRAGLFTVDATSGAVKLLTPDALHVINFDWSPDERELALAAAPDPDGVPIFRTDIHVVDRTNGALRSVAKQVGMESRPQWSPDGKWIAFSSQRGVQTYNAGWPTVVPAAGGEAIAIDSASADEDLRLSPYAEIFWSPDSSGFYYGCSHHMTSLLVRADIKSRRVKSIAADESFYDEFFSMNRDAQRVAFVRSTLANPPELFVGQPGGTARQITRLSNEFPLAAGMRIDAVSWPSADGKFRIHGLLMTPQSAWTGKGKEARMSAPLPLLVFLYGGPSMIARGFARDGNNGAMLPLAARGYAVLAPNTRGRGGYEAAFRDGMRDGSSAGRLGYEDAMGGVDMLVQQGIADPSRLGVYGHSYGGYLTSYVITQTDRFKGAVIHEAHVVQWLNSAMVNTPGSDWELLSRDLYGIRNGYEPAERARLIAESPGLNADRVKTPTLLLFGAQSALSNVGRPLFNALQRFKVPSQMLVYEEGHVFSRPAAVAESLERTAEWLDYFVLGEGADPLKM